MLSSQQLLGVLELSESKTEAIANYAVLTHLAALVSPAFMLRRWATAPHPLNVRPSTALSIPGESIG